MVLKIALVPSWPLYLTFFLQIRARIGYMESNISKLRAALDPAMFEEPMDLPGYVDMYWTVVKYHLSSKSPFSVDSVVCCRYRVCLDLPRI